MIETKSGSSLSIVRFHSSDYLKLIKDGITENTLKHDPAKSKLYAEFYASRGPAFTALTDDGEIAGCAGIMIMWPGVGEAWILFNHELAKKHKKDAYEIVLRHLLVIIEEKKLHRVQAHCNTNLPHAVKYLEGLGFKREGTMGKYDEEGNDHYLYAMVIG